MFGKRKIAALVAEFLGTGILTLLVLSVQRSTIGVPFFIAMAAGLTVAALTFAFGNVSGGYFNPALTFAMWTARKLAPLTAFAYILMQALGAYVGYALYVYYVKNKFAPIGGVFNAHILVAEAVGTGIFALAWAGALYQGFSSAVRASVSGLAYMIGIVSASAAAIGLLNPALAIGVKAWVLGTYVLGPFLGAVVGVNLYGMLFAETEVVTAGATVVKATPVVVAKTPVKATNAVTVKKTTVRKAAVKKKPVARKR
jgi:aquaporin Z